MKLIGKLENCAIYHGLNKAGKEVVQYIAKFAICADGMPKNVYGDPHWQSKTAYRHGGKYLNADKVPYVVVPPSIIAAVEQVVLGSECEVENLSNKMVSDAICGEVGPQNKLGEGSMELARRLGLNPNPLHGGTEDHIIRYTIFVGESAVVDGTKYKLQSS